MEKEATGVVRLGAPPSARISISRSADMRYAGQGHEILVELPDGPFTAASVAELRKRFEAGYRALFNRVVPGVDVEVTAWILRAETPAPGRVGDQADRGPPARAHRRAGGPRSDETRNLFDPMLRDFTSVPVYHRSTLKPGHTLQGPPSSPRTRPRPSSPRASSPHSIRRAPFALPPNQPFFRRPPNEKQPSAEPHRIPGDVEPPDLRRRGTGADPGAHRLRHGDARGGRPLGRRLRHAGPHAGPGRHRHAGSCGLDGDERGPRPGQGAARQDE